jgi:hypothetical protein
MLYSLGICLIVLGSVVAFLNWSTIFMSYRSRRFVSPVPLIGGVLLFSGMFIIPQARSFSWAALVIDYGTLAFFIAVPVILHQYWRTSRMNLLYSFKSNGSGRQIEIKLFRRAIAEIHARFDPPALCNDYDGHVQSFGLVGTWAAMEGGYLITGYCADRQLLLSKNNNLFSTSELHYPSEKKYPYDCLNGLTLERLK